MKTWPKHPVIYEINTWVWLGELSRQHQRPVNLAQYMTQGSKIQRVRRGIDQRQMQARAVLDLMGPRLSEEHCRLLRGFCELGEMDFLSRRAFLLSNRILYPDLPRNLAMLVAV